VFSVSQNEISENGEKPLKEVSATTI
jgi:hypothetical protein